MTEDTNLFMEWIEEPEAGRSRLAEDTDEAKSAGPAQGRAEQDGPERAEAWEGEKAAEPVVRCKFLGEEKTLSLSEAALWAQKGMNAEHQLQKSRDSRENRLIDYFAALSGMDREDYLSALEEAREKGLWAEETAKIRAQYPQLPEELAKAAGGLMAEGKQARIETEAEAAGKRRGREPLGPWLEFAEAFPEVEDLSSLPEEVLSAIDGGASPTAAMQAFRVRELQKENESLRASLEALERNERNREKSVGSARTSGGSGPADPFLLGLMQP